MNNAPQVLDDFISAHPELFGGLVVGWFISLFTIFIALFLNLLFCFFMNMVQRYFKRREANKVFATSHQNEGDRNV